MSRRPLSQIEVEQYIAEDLDRLEDCTADYKEALETEAKAESKYKVKQARMFQAANGTRDEKSAYATEHSIDEFEAFRLAEAEQKALYQALWSIRASLDALRSLNANIRPQVNG